MKKASIQLILEIEDTKLEFFKGIIQNFSFVKIEEDEYEEDTDEQLRKNIRTGVKELLFGGKKKSRSARDFLKEL